MDSAFTEKELQYLTDTDFLLTKAVIGEKVQHWLSQTQQTLQAYISSQNLSFPSGVQHRAGKITKGENYQQLPYYVLDYPRKLAREDIFVLRTLCWWGHYFSVTFQLAGASWEQYRPVVQQNAKLLQHPDVFFCISDDPWQHHREPSYYQSLESLRPSEVVSLMAERTFLKVATFLPLTAWETLPEFALQFFKKMVRVIEIKQ